jgi:hypothetical protein
MATGSGRATIALTSETNLIVDELCERFAFKERSDAGKFGFAYAIRLGLTPAARGRTAGQAGPTGTTWAVGGFDGDGKLRELVRAILPDSEEDPYVTLESLMNQGLTRVAEALTARRPQTLAELVAIAD